MIHKTIICAMKLSIIPRYFWGAYNLFKKKWIDTQLTAPTQKAGFRASKTVLWLFKH
jgi:hypothetical protein